MNVDLVDSMMCAYALCLWLPPQSTGDLEDGLGKTLDVARGDTGHRDTAVLGGVDGVLEGSISRIILCKRWMRVWY